VGSRQGSRLDEKIKEIRGGSVVEGNHTKCDIHQRKTKKEK